MASREEAHGETRSPSVDDAAPGAEAEKKPPTLLKQLSSYFRLLVYADPTWLDITLLCTGTVAAAAAGVPFPLLGILFGQLLDDMNSVTCGADDATAVFDMRPGMYDKILKVVYVSIAMFVFVYVHVVSWSIFSQRLAQRLRDRYLRSLLRQEPSFFDKRQAGEVSARISGDIQAVQSGTSEKVGVFIGSTSFFITAYIVAFVKDAKIAVMLVALLPAFLLMGLVGGFYVQKFSGTMSDAIASASSIASEALSHVSVVQAFGAAPRLERKFADRMAKARHEGIKKAVAAALQAGTLYFIAYAANALAFWQGSIKIADTVAGRGDGTTVGGTYTVVFVLIDACIIFGQVIPLLPLFGAAAAAFQGLEADMDRQSAIDPTGSTGEKLPIQQCRTVELQNVSFSYPSRPDDKVLKDLSITCAAGKHTAIVGLSGSGKSTVAALIARLYDVSGGAVLIDGIDVRTLNVGNLRSCMSLVQQEPLLFNRSILENIALGLLNSPIEMHRRFQEVVLGPRLGQVAAEMRNGRTLSEAAEAQGQDVVDIVGLVRNATDLADASAFIDLLQHGYGTTVGTGGSLVSGGQRQRIALARALIRDPSILILDEATASLDSASERRIQTAIESIARDRTLISIAHRLSTIKTADLIIVLSGGEVVEQGTYAELVAFEGTFANMVRLQNVQSEQSDDMASLASTARDTLDIEPSEKSGPQTAINKNESEREDGREIPVTALVPTDADKEAKLKGSILLKRIGRLVRPNLGWLVLAFVSAIAVGCTYSASGVIFGNIVGTLTPCNSPEEILRFGRLFGGMFFVLAVVELLANALSWSCFGYVAENLLYLLRVRSFSSLFQQGLEWHQAANRSPASLLSIITKDSTAIGGFSGSVMGTIFSIVVNFLVAIVLSHIIAWKIAIVCLVTVPILLGAGIMQLMALSRFEERHADAFSEAVGITVEAVDSIRTIAALSLEQEILRAYRRALKGPRKEMVAASAYANVWLAIANSIGNFVYAFAYWWGSKLIIEGEYNQTQFFIIVVAMLVSAQLWGQMFSLAPEVSRARAAASRILNLIELGNPPNPRSLGDTSTAKRSDTEKDVEALAETTPKTASTSTGVKVAFSDVSFAYPARPSKAVLRDATFTIQPGQFCGLVGPSGAGKSTIMALVQRLYHPTTGVIEVDGVNIADRDGDEFRNDVSVVPQDCALFDGTVKFNVGLGARPGVDATDAEIEAACRVANIHDTIMELPNGYDTECGPNGSQLSGGQRQRLAIARALVRKPRLLLLDESTSALDAESEKALQEGLERAARGITVIAVTHRLHTVQKADVILMVEGGRIVERGTHDELLERSEEYRLNAMEQVLGS